ncbi:MAG: sugar kinase [Actinomycetales bacterium]|nr:sugar kinase [Actinomycetales bacterium]
MRVIHTGQALVDVVVEIESLPERGGNSMARSRRNYAAGAVNILLAAARAGATAVHAGAVGTGPNGDLIRAVLASEGVAVSSPPVPDMDTGICVVAVEDGGERTFITTMEAERHISVESLATSAPRAGDLVCVTGYSLFEPTREPLLEWLETLDDGVVVVLDPGAAFATMPEDVRRRALAVTGVWTSNSTEAWDVTGEADVVEAVPAIAALLPEGAVVVVRDGPEGCWVREAGVTTHVPGYPQDPVDTNGAGDAHTGVLVAEHALGASWTVAARRANAAGAIQVTRWGPSSSPTHEEIDAFLAGQPY